MRLISGLVTVWFAASLFACGFNSNGGGGDGGTNPQIDAPVDAPPGAITLQWTTDPGSFAEGTPVTLGAVLSEPAATDVSATVAVSGGTAMQGQYAFTATTITVPAGATTGSVTLMTVDDGVAEATSGTVIVAMSNPVGDPNLVLGAKTTITTTIAASDAPVISFAAATSTSGEGVTTPIVVHLSKASPLTVTVDLTPTGAAQLGAGKDYTLTPTTVTFAPNETDETVNLATLADGLNEDTEAAVLTLSNATNATADPALNVHTHTITDADPMPTVAFTAASESAAEGAGSLNLTVNLSTASGRDVSFAFAADGSSTATVTDDYMYTSTSPVTIPAGQTSTTIGVKIVQDTIDEADETVVTKLGTLTNATAGAITTNTLTITDDDLACYGEGTFKLCVTRAPQTAYSAATTAATLDSDTSTLCATTQPTWPNQAGAPAVCLIAGSVVTIGSTQAWSGNRPVVYLADTTMTIAAGATVEVKSARSPVRSGAGFTDGGCTDPTQPNGGTSGGGGGAGGTFITQGGNGGKGNNGATNGATASMAISVPTALRGGCVGGAGGGGGVVTGHTEAPGDAGLGGGAVYLVAKTSIALNGSVNASGAGGSGGEIHTGGSGGGSGGMIVLFSGTITLGANARVYANGGGGSGGAGTGGGGTDPVSDPTFNSAPGGTGTNMDFGPAGGAGFGNPGGVKNGVNSGQGGDGGGGGGGGGGYIKSSADLGADASAGQVDD